MDKQDTQEKEVFLYQEAVYLIRVHHDTDQSGHGNVDQNYDGTVG
ncbi:hypothetical protein wTkk_000064 [Wolbachia endosymbiont of Trichogramma kaykai]